MSITRYKNKDGKDFILQFKKIASRDFDSFDVVEKAVITNASFDERFPVINYFNNDDIITITVARAKGKGIVLGCYILDKDLNVLLCSVRGKTFAAEASTGLNKARELFKLDEELLKLLGGF